MSISRLPSVIIRWRLTPSSNTSATTSWPREGIVHVQAPPALYEDHCCECRGQHLFNNAGNPKQLRSPPTQPTFQTNYTVVKLSSPRTNTSFSRLPCSCCSDSFIVVNIWFKIGLPLLYRQCMFFSSWNSLKTRPVIIVGSVK